MSELVVGLIGVAFGYVLHLIVVGGVDDELREENLELTETNAGLALDRSRLEHDVVRANERAHEAREGRIDAYLLGYLEGRRDEQADHA